MVKCRTIIGKKVTGIVKFTLEWMSIQIPSLWACYVPSLDEFHYELTIGASVDEVINYAKFVSELNPVAKLRFGYESGCLGYSLCRGMKKANLDCVIMATSTIVKSAQSKKQKNDRRDARALAKALASNNYKSVYVLSERDEEVRAVIRYRRDIRKMTKITKQQINGFLLQRGYVSDNTKAINTSITSRDITRFLYRCNV